MQWSACSSFEVVAARDCEFIAELITTCLSPDAPVVTCPTTRARPGERSVRMRCEIRARPDLSALFWIIDVNGTTVAEGTTIHDFWSASTVSPRRAEPLDDVVLVTWVPGSPQNFWCSEPPPHPTPIALQNFLALVHVCGNKASKIWAQSYLCLQQSSVVGKKYRLCFHSIEIELQCYIGIHM